ncbi:MAG: 23S rRNA (adenine(2503)-C(2))-methyltransferase RlmN [Gemmataceae bacterium]|nr:23S rRNA (adenine(2503)-C(2))-methyltransferase RlmN [Gemmataceae bacterium]MDW8263945.1 23S rRNA (adenine(2503)-C(2))-methyltransferase RlmN [Gemmataceae bacterium]
MNLPLAPILPTDLRRGILSLSEAEFGAWLRQHGQPLMRISQVRRWLIQGRAESFGAMTDLPVDLRAALAREFEPLETQVAAQTQARDGTRKLLLRLRDGRHIECVLIPERDRRTACVSTQVGCGMGCVFCASGLGGVARNLTSGEILEQLIRLRNLTPRDERLTNIVVMGMGEPLANLDNLVAALEVACVPAGLGISARHVTVSTVGLPTKIRQLAALGKPYHLAVSLHAPNDALRTQIVPTNARIGLAAILAAADDFFACTGRRVTYEYVLLGGVNDAPTHARELARLLGRRIAHVNLIPYNEVAGLPYRQPTAQAVATFVAELRRAGLNVKVRKRKGADIDAACGQLRRRFEAPSAPVPHAVASEAASVQ